MNHLIAFGCVVALGLLVLFVKRFSYFDKPFNRYWNAYGDKQGQKRKGDQQGDLSLCNENCDRFETDESVLGTSTWHQGINSAEDTKRKASLEHVCGNLNGAMDGQTKLRTQCEHMAYVADVAIMQRNKAEARVRELEDAFRNLLDSIAPQLAEYPTMRNAWWQANDVLEAAHVD